MRNFIIALAASIVLPITAMGQSKIQEENAKFYSVPVPDDLKASDASMKSTTVEKVVESGKIIYTIQIKYNPNSKKEAIYLLGITSDDSEQKVVKDEF